MMSLKFRWRSLFFLIALVSLSILILNLNEVDASRASQVSVEKRGHNNFLVTSRFGAFYQTPNKIKDQKVVPVPDTSVQVITWNEVSPAGVETPYYAISLDGQGISQARATSYEVKLRHSTFEPVKGRPVVPGLLQAKNPDNPDAVYIVQFITQPLEEYRRAIRKLGGQDFIYLPNHSHLVRMDPATRQKVEMLPFVRWVGRFEPADKLEEVLAENLTNNVSMMAAARYNIMVLERGRNMQEKLAAKIVAMGGKVENMNQAGFLIEATLSPQQLLEVAGANEVLFIDRWSKPEQDVDIVREVGGANFVRDTLGFRGEGVRAEVLDAGVRKTHVDFNSGLPILQHGANNIDSHGTSTYGISFGRGTANAQGLGMLPEAQGIFADYDFLTSRYTETAELKQAPYFAVYQSNSWGSALTTAYTTVSAQMDDILFINDFTLLNSQGNNANQQSRPEAWAKNVVSVGGMNHFNTVTFDDDLWQNGASVGPAADGRIKPDLAYFYDNIFTTTSTSDTAYISTFGGTSAATPMTAGHFGIFFQMWHNGLFGNPTGASVFLSAPKMSTAKAIMINTASQWSMVAPSDATRFRQGWGHADLRNLYNLAGKMFVVNEADAVTNLQTKTYNVQALGTEPLKITMVYSDPMGNPAASMARINDLTLRVTSPSGTVYFGNNGLATDQWSSPGGVADTVNTVENVFIQTPQAGLWTVDVIASEINQDAKVETQAIDADFALVATGVVPGPPAPPTLSVSPASMSFTATAGLANPAAQSLNLNPGSRTLSWTATSSAPWLSVSPALGTGPAIPAVSVNITGLVAGTYNATIAVSAPGALNTPSAVPVTLIVNPGCPGTNLLANPGFETTANWVLSGATRVTTFPHTGTITSLLGNVNNANHSEYQAITIPAGCSANLRFWLSVTSNETTTTIQNDKIFAEVRNSAGTLLATLATFSNLNKTSSAATYVQRGPYSLSAYAGQTVRIQFRATTNGSLTTAFRVDDVTAQ